MELFQTFLGLSYFVLGLLVLFPLGVVAFLLSFLGLKKPMSVVVYRIVQGWALTMIKVTGCTVKVSGRENIPRKEGICLVSNHQGIFDIVLALAYVGRPFGFIAKKELLAAPFVNIWIWLLGGLFIDRKNPRKALNTINIGIKRIRQGGAMIIFPEGTRSKGRGLLPFHPGSFKLATQAGARIVPMAITGSYEVFEKHRRVHSVPLTLSFAPPMETGTLSREERKQLLANRVREIIEVMLPKPDTTITDSNISMD